MFEIKELVFLNRRMNGPKGIAVLPRLDPVALKKAGADLLLRSAPSTLAAGHLLVTGEVERKTLFEEGMPGMEAFIDGRWVPDPINDDQALVIVPDPEDGLAAAHLAAGRQRRRG